MDYIIRNIREEEYRLLDDFLYEAIFIPKQYSQRVERDIIYTDPKLYDAIRDFGTYADDRCLVAEVDGKVAGAVWTRIADEYGHLDDNTPSLAISLYEEYRGKGIGTELVRRMLRLLKEQGYQKVSLSVNEENFAVKIYEKFGFKKIGDGVDETETLMIKELRE